MVSSSNGQEAILVGCAENPEKIYKLRWCNATNLEWVLMWQKLKYPRSNAVAILIPYALTHCKIPLVTTTTLKTTEITTPITLRTTTSPTTSPTTTSSTTPTTTPTTTSSTTPTTTPVTTTPLSGM